MPHSAPLSAWVYPRFPNPPSSERLSWPVRGEDGEPSPGGQREPVTVTTDLVREVPSALIANGHSDLRVRRKLSLMVWAVDVH